MVKKKVNDNFTAELISVLCFEIIYSSSSSSMGFAPPKPLPAISPRCRSVVGEFDAPRGKVYPATSAAMLASSAPSSCRPSRSSGSRRRSPSASFTATSLMTARINSLISLMHYKYQLPCNTADLAAKRPAARPSIDVA